MNIKKIIYGLHSLERNILNFLNLKDLSDISKESKLSEQEIRTGVLMLEQKGFTNFVTQEKKLIVLDKFGEIFVKSELPEIQVLNKIINGSKKQSELKLDNQVFSSAIGVLKREKLVDTKKEKELIFTITSIGKKYLKDNAVNPLKLFEKEVLIDDLTKEQKLIIEKFKQRKGFLKEISKKNFSVGLTSNGKKLVNEFKKNYSTLKLIDSIDSDMLKTGSWKNYEFRHYDVGVKTSLPVIGRRHPMIEANNVLRDIFVEMGFVEMTGPMVESAFWNMDVMWIPQDHPARDEQDTFYLEGSAKLPKEYVKKVKKMHEIGIKRSHTPIGDWSEEISSKILLRTHSTATTFRTLSELGKKYKNGENINGKYFYNANNFRNEAVDATHLAEFFQAEGFIVGDDLSLADLMGFVREYYLKLGIDKIQFKPTFNPYTEPSMEAHYYDPKMDKWYALINSGIFRAETLTPFGLEKKTVIAWGMGASRVAALLSRKNSMRDFTGFTCDFEWLKTRPIMRREIIRKRGNE